MSAFDELEQNVSDLTDNLNDLSDSFGSYSTDNDSNISDIQESIQDQSDSIENLNNNAGQLSFPLTQDTIDLLRSIFITGTVTIGSGSTVTDPRIGVNSIVLFSVTNSAGTAGFISASKATGQVIFGSTSGADHSTLNYLILP
jgi:ElaB/YqjD/DUF883 family membrane-anchored ribosome-binding protein